MEEGGASAGGQAAGRVPPPARSSNGLEPRFEQRGGRSYWVVEAGRRVTGRGRQRHYFNSQAEAKTYGQRLQADRLRFGWEAFRLTMAQRVEAARCFERLAQAGLTLTEAVDDYLSRQASPGATLLMSELADKFLLSRRAINCRPRSITEYRSHMRIIVRGFGMLPVASVATRQLSEWLAASQWSPRTRKNYLTTLTTLFNFAIKQGYRDDNPAASIDRPRWDEAEVRILTVPQAKNLLAAAMAKDPPMLPALAIGLFAGLRRSEIFSLQWGEIEWEHKVIKVRSSSAKSRRHRLVAMAENLVAWLKPFRRSAGRVCPVKYIDGLSERLRPLAAAAGIAPWPANVLRHSFGSYFMGKTRDEKLTTAEMGNSPDVLMHHYRALVHQTEVEAYWAILPPGVKQD